MPWKVDPVSDLRFALCHAVRSLRRPVAVVAREFGVSRKTAHKWLNVYDGHVVPGGDDDDATVASISISAAAAAAAALADRSRRPGRSPAKTGDDVERQVLAVRDRYNWGPRKIRAFLLQEAERAALPPPPLPSARTFAAILTRHARVRPKPPPQPVQRFERARPNELWQIDHKGPVEVERRKLTPFTVVDDHSRYCLSFRPCDDKTMAGAFAILWDVFADAGLPEAILSDNAFNTPGIAAPGLSWFDSRLIRLGIRPAHGRPYHPQTQGKCERLHGSAVREFICFNARRDRRDHFDEDAEHWRGVYNTRRPHEALGDRPPLERWRPSERRRPAKLPEPTYEPGQVTRKIDSTGEISFRGYRILIGRGLVGERVRVEEHDAEVRVYYCSRQVRSLSPGQLVKDKLL
jgi:transposase InsO family protein